MICPFNVSDKVVCVGGKPILGPDGTESTVESGLYRIYGFIPQVNSVYVVEAILTPTPETGLALVGSTAICKNTGVEVGWHWTGFRKLEEVKAENVAKQAIGQQISQNANLS